MLNLFQLSTPRASMKIHTNLKRRPREWYPAHEANKPYNARIDSATRHFFLIGDALLYNLGDLQLIMQKKEINGWGTTMES